LGWFDYRTLTRLENDPNSTSPRERPLVSLIIPMLNERDGLKVLFDRLEKSLHREGVDWELIIVDDGSTDGTRLALPAELARFPRWQVIGLSRNFGQQPAYRAGLDHACGDAVIFSDADLQDPPELMPQLIQKWREGFKVVTGRRTSREEGGLRGLLMKTFHRIFHHLTDGAMPINSGMFALVDRAVVNQLVTARETNLFLPALKCWYGFPQTTVEYARQARAVGAPKQSFRKLFRYGFDGLFSFSELPLQWIAALGVFISVCSFGYAAFLVAVKIVQSFGYFLSLEVKGFTTLAVAIFCLGGVQLICLGIIGQYLARMYREIKGRPLYVVETVVHSDESRRIHESRAH
jgi:polyisoprenyl-phosphate glycosyltransferase